MRSIGGVIAGLVPMAARLAGCGARSEHEKSKAAIEKLGGHFKGSILYLTSTEITGAGLEQVKGLEGLKILFLGNTKITENGVRKLQAALPRLRLEGKYASLGGRKTTRR